MAAGPDGAARHAGCRRGWTKQGLAPKTGVEAFATPRRLTACRPSSSTGRKIATTRSWGRRSRPRSTPKAIRRRRAWDSRASSARTSTRWRRRTRRAASTSRISAASGAARPSTCYPRCSRTLLRDLTFPKQMHWDAAARGRQGRAAVRPADSLAALPLRRPCRAVHDLAAGHGVESARPGRDDGRRDVRPSLSRDQRPRGPRDQSAELRRVSQEADRELRPALARSIDAIASCAISRRTRGGSAAGRCCKQCGRRGAARGSARSRRVPGRRRWARSARSSCRCPAEVLTTTLIHHQHFFPVVGTNGCADAGVSGGDEHAGGNDRAIATNAERVVTARLRDARFFWDADRSDRPRAQAARASRRCCSTGSLGSYAAEGRAHREAGASGSRPTCSGGRLRRTRRRARRGSRKPILRPTWSASSPSCRAPWAAFTRVRPASRRPSGGRSTSSTCRWRRSGRRADGVGARAGCRGLGLRSRSPTSSIPSSDCSWRASGRPDSRDPFGLRRAAHGIVRILVDTEALTGVRVRASLDVLIGHTLAGYGEQDPAKLAEFKEHLSSVPLRTAAVRLQARGADRRNIRAVLAGPGIALSVPVSDLHENLRALPEFARSEQFRQLATAFKRIRNIANDSPVEPAASDGAWSTVLKEAAERALLDEIAKRQPAIQKAVASGAGFREAYAEAAGFEPAVARFFNEVFVMADDPALRRGRLRLMKRAGTPHSATRRYFRSRRFGVLTNHGVEHQEVGGQDQALRVFLRQRQGGRRSHDARSCSAARARASRR